MSTRLTIDEEAVIVDGDVLLTICLIIYLLLVCIIGLL
jgi:hypothetical protein